jgi:DNA-binding MarR family transcriptional regulator
VDPDDRRATMATLTAQGQRALQRAYPKHLASVRRRVVDHIDTAETTALGPVLERLAELTETPRCLGEDAGHLP